MFTRAWVVDVVERVVATFLMAFVSALVLRAADLFNLLTWKAAVLAGAAAALSLLKGVLATVFSQPGSAALLPRTGRHVIDAYHRRRYAPTTGAASSHTTKASKTVGARKAAAVRRR